jgi:D-lyxose ketol-isomerase
VQDTAYRREQLRRLQEEVIELEDLKTGISITDLGLNDFRMDLLNYVKTNGDLTSLPNGMRCGCTRRTRTWAASRSDLCTTKSKRGG